MKLTPDERLFLREGALERFLKAQALVREDGFDLRVYDGWRPVELQESLFWYYMREFTAAKFNLGDEFKALDTTDKVREHFLGLPQDSQVTMKEANRTFVSWPSKDRTSPSPHATGGSVDVWLYRDDQPCNLGVPFDWMEEDAGAFYHLKPRWARKRFKGNERRISEHRNILLLAMVRAGFTCYGPEIWHFNYGNQMDALVRGGDARYTYCEPS